MLTSFLDMLQVVTPSSVLCLSLVSSVQVITSVGHLSAPVRTHNGENFLFIFGVTLLLLSQFLVSNNKFPRLTQIPRHQPPSTNENSWGKIQYFFSILSTFVRQFTDSSIHSFNFDVLFKWPHLSPRVVLNCQLAINAMNMHLHSFALRGWNFL